MPVKLTRREFVHAAGGATAFGLLGCSPSVTPAVPPDDLVYATLRSRPRQAHGRQDQILAIDATSRPIVRSLKKDGYDVEYEEFDGRHTITADEVSRAIHWFIGR